MYKIMKSLASTYQQRFVFCFPTMTRVFYGNCLLSRLMTWGNLAMLLVLVLVLDSLEGINACIASLVWILVEMIVDFLGKNTFQTTSAAVNLRPPPIDQPNHLM